MNVVTKRAIREEFPTTVFVHCSTTFWDTPDDNIQVRGDLPMEKYHSISDEVMESLLESLESLLDSLDEKQYEVEYHSGVLTLKLGDKGTYVINKQPPNKQIWLSSPVSGPKRYDYSKEKDIWFYARDGKTIGTLLKEELAALLGITIDIPLK